MHMNYFSSTVDYNGDDLDNVCPDIVEGLCWTGHLWIR